jgi:tRNA 5-methylaminomethyl-2-thiouridine biosynthesis bifunctional protein
MTLQPTRLVRDADGNAWSERYGDVYASRDGALGQARHVFLQGNGLPQRWRGRGQFVVLEIGFGLGINFLATWQAWRGDPHRPTRLHFVSVERHPLSADDLRAGTSGELCDLAEMLASAWPQPLPGLHRLEFERGDVVLTLALGDARALVPQLVVGADAIYLDGFAPSRNPEMWEPALLKSIARCARPGATVATYTSAQSVHASLSSAGFELQVQSGFGRKREMLAGIFAPKWRVRRHEPQTEYRAERAAIVIGAGLAGCACAEALARRGWSVQVFDRQARPATGASALPWGLLHPQFAVDDAPLARLTRAGVAAARAALDRVAPNGDFDGRCVARISGVFQLASEAAEAERWQWAVERLGLPSTWITWCSQADASEWVGMRPSGAGLWWPGGMLVCAPRWCCALLASHSIAMRRADVGSVAAAEGGWRVLNAHGKDLASAPVVIVAAALESPTLLDSAHARVRAVRGRIASLQPDAWEGLRAPVTGDGYLLRDPDGGVSVGATYEATTVDAPSGHAQLSRERALQGNLARVSRLLAAPPEPRAVGTFEGIRCVAHDRMPLAGVMHDEIAMRAAADQLRGAHLIDLPRRDGLCACFALGSRGLTLASLLAEVIVAQIEGEPLPIERDLAATVDPARFALRSVRHGRSWLETMPVAPISPNRDLDQRRAT